MRKKVKHDKNGQKLDYDMLFSFSDNGEGIDFDRNIKFERLFDN